MSLQQASGKLLIVVAGALVLGAGLHGRPVVAQAQSGTVAADPYQRSADHFVFKASAKSGPQHGEELYYYKCSFCHIRFAQRAPDLKDLFKRPNVTDQTVADKIRKGGPNMPAYATTLSEADVADLVSYLKEKCCWEGEDPPPNPRYRAGTTR